MPTKELNEQLNEERRRVDFDTYDITVQQLASMVSKRQIDIAPIYQRQFRWNATRQSQFIESLALGIPVPSLFMATNQDGTWEVVDGVQRISTIVHFVGDKETRRILNIDDSLVIQDLEKLSTMNGMKFSDLPQNVQLQFVLRPVKVTTLSDKSDLKVRFDLFERLNTGGLSLTDQEIRGVIYRGRFNDFLEKLSKNKNFKKVVLLRPTMETDGTREEYVLRFFSYLYCYKSFEHSVKDFLSDYMAAATKSFEYDKQEELFVKTFEQLAPIFPSGISRGRKHTPANLFEAVAVGAAMVIRKNRRLKSRNVNKWLNSVELRNFTTGATNSRPMVVGRIEYVADKFGAN